MKYYKSYTAKKLKLPRRILFFLIIAVAIFVFSVILGNNLKKRLNEADINTDPVETVDLDNIENEQNDKGGGAVHETKAYSAGYLDLNGEDDASSGKTKAWEIGNKGYTCLSFVAADENGLRYASPAMSSFSRLPVSEKVASYEALTETLTYAKSIGLRCSAVFTAAEGEADMLIVAELAEMGFDEIIIRGFEASLSENGGDITKAVAYLEKVREKADCDISLSLTPAAYTLARNSYHIEQLFTYTEFLTVDLTSSSAEDVAAFADGFEGSFATYSLRALVTAEQTDVEETLETAGFSVSQYVTATEPDAPDSGTDE